MREPESNSVLFMSFGYRCSTSGILKRMGLKQESHPFDWLISRLSIIHECIDDNFTEFLNTNNYIRKYAKTYEMFDRTTGYICDEHLMVNMHYQPPDKCDEPNAYQYFLAMNHHNITEPTDYEYYQRCVTRFQSALKMEDTLKIYIHIMPAVSMETLNENLAVWLKECKSFDLYMQSMTSSNSKGLFFIIARSDHGEPRFELVYTDDITGSRIYVIYANRGFIDAGEIFMGNSHLETEYIMNCIREFVPKNK